MSEELLSSSEAARQLEVSRRTLSRYLNSGRLKWHGKNRRGSTAKGIRLSEARKVKSAKPDDGRNISRSKMTPVVRRVCKGLSEKLPGSPDLPFTPEQVIKTYVAATLDNQLDVDFLLYCIERLHDGDQIFAAIATGHDVHALLCTGLRRWAAEKLHACAEEAKLRMQIDSGRSFDDLDQTFDFWWMYLAGACLNAPVRVEPAIVVDCNTKTSKANSMTKNTATATMELVPSWFRDVPEAMTVGEVLPVVGGHHSVVVWRRNENTDRVNAIATRLAVHAGWLESDPAISPDTSPQVVYLERLLAYQDEDSGAPDLKASPGFIAAAEGAGLSVDEALLLLREWRRIGGDIAARRHASFDDAVGRSSNPHAGFCLRTTDFSQILGVSRQTAAKLKRKYRAVLRHMN